MRNDAVRVRFYGMTLRGRLAGWWADYRERISPSFGRCLICRADLGDPDAGVELADGSRLCSDECLAEYGSRSAW